MMKRIFTLALIVWSLASPAETKPHFATKRQTASNVSPCERKVRDLIIKTAKLMGQKEDFGFQLTQAPEGVDLMNRPLVSYSATVFIVPEGTVSNSAAKAIVRTPDTTCDVVKIAVSIGG